MEAGNNGPYAKLIRLSNGRYKRIVDPVPPKIFSQFHSCCNGEANIGELDLMTTQPQHSYDTNNTFMYKTDSSELDQKLSSKQYTKLYTPQLTDGHENMSRSSSTQYSESSEGPENQDNKEELNHMKTMEEDIQIMVVRGGTTVMSNNSIGSNLEGFDNTDNEAIPILFYTKNRDKPALLMMTVDAKMQVIFMKRNRASRFFPIKLIGKFITSPQIIEAEFSRQIKSDPTVRVKNMVLFNASNFTDCVAIQFADESAKTNFINEVNRIKDLIKGNY